MAEKNADIQTENEITENTAEKKSAGKAKRILAIVGIVLLCGMYLASFLLAIFDNSDAQRMFFASVAATIIIPVLIWAYTFIYKLLTKGQDIDRDADRNADRNTK